MPATIPILRRQRGLQAVIASSLLLVAQAAAIDPEFAFVPASDIQTGGPEYDFRVTVFEIRNDAFVAFLNDAMANLDNERGQYLYFDLDSENVYIHNSATGVTGLNGSGPLLYDASANSYISFSLGRYVVPDQAYAAHPATGMSWFGAVKFCNWLTLDRGLPAEERAYTEAPGTNLNGWHPVTLSTADWATRDLNDSERSALLEKLGYRLLMGGFGPRPYNEWRKAAAARLDGGGIVIFDALYGFGRNTVGPQDANYSGSGDPFESGTTPVGFYDGVNMLGDGFTPTLDTGNAYGLHDLSGNVWEWIQDRGTTLASRGNRGGSFRSVTSSLTVGTEVDRLASSTVDSTGFRIAQSVPSVLQVFPVSHLVGSGPWGGPYDQPGSETAVYAIMNFSGDAQTYIAFADVPWVLITPNTAAVQPDERIDVTVTVDPSCYDGLVLGENLASVTFENAWEEVVAERNVQLTVREPLAISPTTNFSAAMAYGRAPSPPNLIYLVDNGSDRAVSWSASWDETSPLPSGVAWLTVDPNGQVLPHGVDAVAVAVDGGAAAALPPGTYTADVEIIDECTGGTFARSATLTVSAPFNVTPSDPVVSTGVAGNEFDPPAHDFTVSNLLNASLTWAVMLCVEEPGTGACTSPALPTWLELDIGGGTLPGLNSDIVTASITETAASMVPGSYSLTLRFEEPATGFEIERLVTLEVTSLLVTPVGPVEFSGPLAGPFMPSSFVYELKNSDEFEMSWQALVEYEPGSSLNWLTVEPSSGVILDPGGMDTTDVTLTADALRLPPGTHEATIRFAALGSEAVRSVRLIVGGEAFSVPMAMVPASDAQALGPQYDYRIGKYEITNSEYARFLNDALRNKSELRGQFLYHDTDSGAVYINDAAEGMTGTGAPSATVSILIYDSSDGRIGYDANLQEPYFVKEGYESHPVVGVSWYGAAKFCNWMTLLQGMPAGECAYTEGPNASAWGPVTIDAASLVGLAGFRLPMDDGAEAASTYNEWYKAASRMGLDPNGDPEFGALYGFGRNVLTPEDANYLDNGDTQTNGTTPVAFFDGARELFSGAMSRDTGNGYGLYDLCGNAAEWVHDLDGSPGTVNGATRGGHHGLGASLPALRTDHRAVLPADSTFGFVGFRIVQCLTPVELAVDQASDQVRADGVVGGPYLFDDPTQDSFTITLRNDAAYTLDDLSFSVSSQGGWLVFDGIPPRQVPPGSMVELRLRLGDAVEDLLVSPRPSDSMRLVPGRDIQQEATATGPTYDYWISPTEVTNAEYAAFLNDARADAFGGSPGLRSDYLYFDLTSGGVYINTKQTAEEGTNGISVTTPSRLIYDATVGRIGFDVDRYAVEAGFEDHPVVGVSWFGAVKYCNWLTVSRGLPGALRAYREGTDPAFWHPVTVDAADWALGNLNDVERNALVRSTVGYRLPMDDGSDNLDASADSVDDYNEWYKAATRRIDADGLASFDTFYGFGRDELTGADANFLNSGDTQVDDTTPVAFFDGVHSLFDEQTATNDSENGYGLYDLTGNVAEWVQDFFTIGDGTTRATRGGSWADAAVTDPGLFDPHRNDSRAELAPASADSKTGFRVVRGSGHLGSVTIHDRITGKNNTQYVILDLREPFELTPLDGRWIAGPFCADFEGAFADPFTLINRSNSDMPWSVQVDMGWVTLTGPEGGALSGTIPGGSDETVDIVLGVNESANDLPPGKHVATIRFANTFTGQAFARELSLTVEQPIEVTPDLPVLSFDGFWEDAFEELPAQMLTLSRCSTCDGSCVLDYTVFADAGWLVLGPNAVLSGTVPPPGQSIDVQVNIDESAATLSPGTYTGTIEFELSDAAHGALSGALTRTVELLVKPPIEVLQPAEETWNVDCEIDIDTPPTKTYALANRHSADEIGVTVDVDVDWIDVDPPSLTILPGQVASVTLTLTDEAIPVPGDYAVEVTIQDAATGRIQTRDLSLVVGGQFCVRPFTHIETSAPVGGVPIAGSKSYRLTNLSIADAQSWSMTTNPSADWVLVNGMTADSAGGVISPGASIATLVSFDPDALAAQFDPAGPVEQTLTTALEFRVAGGPAPLTRNVSVTLVDPSSTTEVRRVAARPSEPGGPEYSYLMGRFETSNEEFVIFLNDALARPDHPRGAYMYFDTSTGDVYVHSTEMGGSGDGPGQLTTFLYKASVGRIQMVGGVYTPEAGFENHPVVGVSWYGALKYCNWLTLDQGIGKNQRCYTEATASSLDGWHPVTTTTLEWAACDLNDARRAALFAYRGYRLPMDDGSNNGDPPLSDATSDGPDDYNEWYKAAAFNGINGHWVYGFGRSELNPADGVDANYWDANLPFAETTPVGFFGINGDRTWDDPLFGWGDPATPMVTVQATENYYGLHDMTGNVYHWIQGRYGGCGDPVNRRTIRGGKWAAADARTLLATHRNYSVPQATTNTIGFRVMRTVPEPGDFDADGDLDAGDFLGAAACLRGPEQPLIAGCEPFDADGDGDGDLYDLSVFLEGFAGGF